MKNLYNKKTILLDGAFGSNVIDKFGIMENVSTLNLYNEDFVFNLHLNYLKAGSDIILTNTFSAGNLYYDFNLMVDVIYNGIKIAKNATSKFQDKLVAYNISDIFNSKENKIYDFHLMKEVYKIQIDLAVQHNVDFFYIETMTNLKNAMNIVDLISKVTIKPIFLSFVPYDGFDTQFKKDVDLILKKNIFALGFNCFSIEKDIFNYLNILKNENIKLILKPNMGIPIKKSSKYVYEISETQYVKKLYNIINLVENKTVFVGGCCGTTPHIIKTLSKLIKDE
ncbi:MAG: homocysteine S-methyltransferase family protein [Oscillospiraceae bacterium]